MHILLSFVRFVIELSFNFYIMLVLLRFLLQCVKANFYHPVIQMLVKLTNPVLMPIRRVTPIINSYDWSCIILALALELIKYCLLMFIFRISISPLFVIGIILLDIGRLMLYIYIFAFFLRAIASWLGSDPRNSMVLALLNQLTDPLLKRFPLNLRWRMIDFRPTIIIILLFIAVQFLFYLQNLLLI